ncbi:monovalent cation:H+ antiporter, CPA1 (nhx1) [Coccidioides posadasii str. Silveira]|uniref:Sodium/hydrogen exchanger n=1 Tax=Coccidioides posadasii (strain RMSCC 757 / Silveira) TaxID=443226 RepID=E9DB45_COCPS|nr:sodium/hydrogen exchanger 6 [Coccidioides posadasii str. Silveira]QVM11196.1 monovalent cation:H+ antiporter, CPA1 (nhx1) [Coccidioides posadasii str. Silveira]
MMASVLQDLAWGSLRKRMEEETDPDESPEAGEQEFWTSWALFILILLLIAALFTSYMLKQKRVQAVHETVLSIFSGMVVGLIIRVSPGTLIQKSVSFNYQFFFNLLLPPIILASGYELHQANFFRNIGAILTFAFAGTFISALVLGLILYLWTRIPLDGLNISFVEAISVGATLSATDPVTILAIFNVYKVEPKLYTVIFGESILNDAIAIVLFETAQRYKPGSTAGSLTVLSLFEAIGIFLLVFFGSLLIGVVVGVVTALGLKYTHVRREPKIESCLIVLVAYASYFFSNGVHMSGIVSLLFCGITLKHYAYYNMSRRTQLTTKFIFQILAQLSENFIFIYLGLDLFTEENLQFKPLFILVTVVGICVARYMSVFPLSKAINWFIRYRARRRGKDVADELPFSYQAMLYWAGLRGAVGVALAAGLEGTNAPALRATVLVVVVLTVIIFGGTTARMLEILDIRTGVAEGVDSDDEFDIEMTDGGTYYKRSGTGIGHTTRRSDFTIPLDSVHITNGLDSSPHAGESYATSRHGGPSPQPGEGRGNLASRKPAGYNQRDRNPRSRDAASSQALLGSRSVSQNGSASGSSADEAAMHSRNRATSRAASKALADTDPDLEDFDLELDSISDDDHLPPAAPSHRASRTPSRLSTRAPHDPSPVSGQAASSSSPAPAVTAGQAQSQQGRPIFSGATSAFRDLLSGAGSRDHAEWFKQLDEEYIKPKLLLDQGSGHKGPGAA